MKRKRRSYHHGDLKNALIAAGIEILSKQGAGALSLRSVAQKVGVSHAAPYAHFVDKQALIAAISTEGYERLYEAIRAVVAAHQRDPVRQLVEGAWAYVSFALDDPEHFKVTLSGVVEKEKDYPAFVEVSKKSFELVVGIVEACQAKGVLPKGSPDLVAVGVWSMMHGLVSLLLENQIPRSVVDRMPVRSMLVATLSQMARLDLEDPCVASS
jgi:AcrR family transcriptional regulator